MSVALHRAVDGPAGGPVLVLGSSLGTTLDAWDELVPALSERLRVVRFDARGHGASPAPPGPYEIADLAGDVLALLDDLGVRRAHYAGLSLGAMLGMWIAANEPARVDRLVLMCTSAHMAPRSAWEQRAADVRAAGSVDAVADSVVDRWLTPPFAAERPQVRASLRAMLAGCDPGGYAACCEAIGRMDQRASLARIAAPTLVVSGSDDPATPREHQRVIAEAIAGARWETIAPAAHLATAEQPLAATRLILDHLEAT